MNKVWTTDYNELNDFEKLKLVNDGLDIVERLPKYQKSGFESIDLKERNLLKWAGVNVQKPRNAGYFLMRVKIPSGVMNSDQARVLATIAKDYGRGILDLTTRQAFQFHWLTIETIPMVMKILNKVDLQTIGSEGDCPRTIIGNPLAGIDPNETIDTRELVQEVSEFFQGNREFSNLPRKFKISISANVYNVGHAEINDLAFTPAIKKDGKNERYGFHVYVGGGLSAQPYLAQKLNLFVHPGEVLKVSIAVTTLFRDYGYRKNRRHARLKFLLADWGKAKFETELLKLTGPLETAGIDLTRGWNAGYFYGVHPQKQSELNYVGLSVPLGRLSAEDLLEVAECADKYGDGSIRTCLSKNLVLANIPTENIAALLAEKIIRRFTPYPKPFVGYTVSCTGKEFCTLALVETKEFALRLAQTLDKKVKLDTPLRIHVNGCPNSCGHLQIADIGLRGTIEKLNGEAVEKFELSIGGSLGMSTGFATTLQGVIPSDRVHQVLEDFINFYKTQRHFQESFNDFVSRLGTETFQELLNPYIESPSKLACF
ncbi:nitrite/sulfite reductase [Desulfosporosinus nitroreducens]|uniref:nitrite/sulfite reductase n=1 Tax=Desulfosporosinus nitroreducens TaxID=2018668 RepID=UPI00207CE6D0|nr:nitrite/sulfite reductase [Desulfosporosinus nitroreducens]MCO1601937.1 nitrite/sulfite reductase [Desulfosporosinus nitroreducens]